MQSGLLRPASRTKRSTTSRRGMVIAKATGIVNQTGISTVTDITGLTITFTVFSGETVEVELLVPYILSATAGLNGDVHISDNANTVIRYGLIYCGASGAYSAPGSAIETITTPGTYTRKGRAERLSGTGTITINAGVSTTEAVLKATVVS